MTEVFASIGECMIELSAAGEGLYRRGFAGDTFNTAWTVRGLTDPGRVSVRYLTAVGDDAVSGEMVRFFETAGIDASFVRVQPGRTAGLYMISLDGAERSFTYWRDMSAAKMLAADPDALARSLEGVTTAYLSGITLAILAPEHRRTLLGALGTLKAAGARIAFDPNVRLRLWPSLDDLREALVAGYSAATVALPTYPDEKDLFDDQSIEDAARRIAGYGLREFVLKDGPEPCLVMADGAMSRVPATVVDAPVDTTGAGDAFAAAFLLAWVAGAPPGRAAAAGTAQA
ncbi:MAG TPA: sugar kinase, partial [Methylomirabilota bacterium]|nr:sugar kinase [Methylomirabilota bacterium]